METLIDAATATTAAAVANVHRQNFCSTRARRAEASTLPRNASAETRQHKDLKSFSMFMVSGGSVVCRERIDTAKPRCPGNNP